MAGRFDIGGSSKPSAASRQGGNMTQQDKIKIGAAVAILVLGGAWICYYVGMFDSLLTPKPDPTIPIVDGKPLPPEEVEEFRAKEREYKKANDDHAKEVGPPAGS